MIPSSQLIINPDGTIYHINLKPGQIANDIITVGDPARVEKITKHFDSIEFSTVKREFKTQTGYYKGKRLTVISTGIGPDNIDIVFNELDALVNVDFNKREIKPQHTALNIIRIGTSGSIQADVPLHSTVIARKAIGTDNMLRSYILGDKTDPALEDAFIKHTNWAAEKGRPYAVTASEELASKFASEKTFDGITVTNGGFYGPQGRVIRLGIQDQDLNDKLASFETGDLRVTNLEMETAAIYGLSALLGHNAVSLSAIIANRALETFSDNPEKPIADLITYVLDKIAAEK
ncbi:nucleoside phosphorylase [Flavobacterium silvaticum]|uniref:Uridine phosphorylase n=1 Tax=Flavobacterium silvaticum TaxID=1852020 RepID=A0A972FTD9_9FLAO|nr:nucleoside phosphorylase [Flavobacterium silvaticum]NMH29014.1 nucleoside phosphorylase [Flavobacterium silvaticum]